MAQAGADPNGVNQGALEKAVRDVDWKAAEKSGQVSAQIQIAHNQTVAQINTTYAQIDQAARAMTNAQVGAAGASSVDRLLAAEQHRSAQINLQRQEKIAAEQTRVQLLSLADQWELQGNQWLAGYLKDMSQFVTPMGDIVATLMAMDQMNAGGGVSMSSMKRGGNIGLQLSNVVSKPFTPASTNTNKSQEGQGASNTRGNTVGGNTTLLPGSSGTRQPAGGLAEGGNWWDGTART